MEGETTAFVSLGQEEALGCHRPSCTGPVCCPLQLRGLHDGAACPRRAGSVRQRLCGCFPTGGIGSDSLQPQI